VVLLFHRRFWKFRGLVVISLARVRGSSSTRDSWGCACCWM